jgi:hopene-associated glycosyltransferase HpnB
MHHDWIFAISGAYLIAALPLAIWLYMLAARGGFWRVSRQTLAAQQAGVATARIAVVIPARNEAESVGQCVASLLAQQPQELHIFLVDDGSSDGTADVARAAAQQAQRAADLTILTGQPLPSGWTGKLWAVQQGIGRAREFAPEFILLTDADIVHAPGSLAQLVAVARRGYYDLTSLMVRLSCESAAERWLMPAFVFFFFMLYPPRWIADPHRRTAGAAGGCMLVSAEVLDKLNAVTAIRREIIDDCALARLIKRGGGRTWLGLAGETVSLRRYRTAGEVGEMIARTAFNQLHHSAVLLLLTVFGMALCFVLPFVLLFTGNAGLAALGLLAWLSMSLAYFPMIRYYRRNPLWSLTLLGAALFYMGATIASAVRYWSGRGGQWKGRAQDVNS